MKPLQPSLRKPPPYHQYKSKLTVKRNFTKISFTKLIFAAGNTAIDAPTIYTTHSKLKNPLLFPFSAGPHPSPFSFNMSKKRKQLLYKAKRMERQLFSCHGTSQLPQKCIGIVLHKANRH